MSGVRLPPLPPGRIFLPNEPGNVPLPRLPAKPFKTVTPQLKSALEKAVRQRRARKQYQTRRATRNYKISPITMSLFNATALCDPPDIIAIFNRIKQNPPQEIVSASIKGGQFKELARYNSKGVVNMRNAGYKPNQIQLTFRLDSGINVVNIFSNGYLRLTGKSNVDDVVKYTGKFVSDVEDVIVSNSSGQFSINQNIKLNTLMSGFPRELLGSKGSLSRSTLGLTYKSTGSVITNVTKKGPYLGRLPGREVRVTTREPRPEKEEKTVTSFALTFYPSGVIQFKGKFADPGMIISLVREILDRTPNVFIGKMEGESEFFEREPTAPKNTTFKTRSTNPPNPPDSFEGRCAPGYYCRPNAQGFPTCYKIPNINASAKKTVVASYKTAGVPIPASVKQLFGIEVANSTNYGVRLSVEKQKFRNRTVEVLKIGGRQCARMTEDQLESVARRLGVSDVRKGMGIAKMCQRLKAFATEEKPKLFIDAKRVRGRLVEVLKIDGKPCYTYTPQRLAYLGSKFGMDIDPRYTSSSQICASLKSFAKVSGPRRAAEEAPSFRINGQPYYVVGNSIRGAQRKNGKPNPSRKCATLPVATVQAYARAMGLDPTGKSRPTLCAEMAAYKRPYAKAVVAPPPEIEEDEEQPSAVNKRRERFIKAMGNVPYTNSNVNYYSGLDTTAKRAAYTYALKRNYKLSKGINLTGIPVNKQKQYKNEIIRFSRTKKGVSLPSNAEVNAYRRKIIASYIRIHSTYGGRNKTGPGGAKANTETM